MAAALVHAESIELGLAKAHASLLANDRHQITFRPSAQLSLTGGSDRELVSEQSSRVTAVLCYLPLILLWPDCRQWAPSVSSGNRKAAAQIRQAQIFPPGVLDRRHTNAEPSFNRFASNDRCGRGAEIDLSAGNHGKQSFRDQVCSEAVRRQMFTGQDWLRKKRRSTQVIFHIDAKVSIYLNRSSYRS